MHHILGHPYIRDLLSLSMPTGDYVIAGSGPLFAHNLIPDLRDLDIATRGSAWDIATRSGIVECAPHGNVRQVRLFDGHIEIFDGWFPELGWDVDVLIDQADIIGGMRFLQLPYVVSTKKFLGRPRDLEHLRLLDEFMARVRE